MLGSDDPTPFDGYAFLALCVMALVLLAGCVAGPRWTTAAAQWVRWGALLLSALVLSVVLIVTPTTSGVTGAGRLLTLYPVGAVVGVLFLAWSRRLGRLW